MSYQDLNELPPISLDLFRTFLAVHRAGSLSAAAHLLGLSQPAVTGQVQTLERRLGRPLFHRHARGVSPTAAGDELASRIAGPLDELLRALGQETRLPGRPLHLGGPAELTTLLVAPALAPLAAGGLPLRFSLGLAEPLLAQLAAGELDLVISPIRPRRRGVVAEPLFDEEFVLVGAPSWAARLPAAQVAAEGTAALAGVPVLAYAEDLPIVRRYWRHVFGVRPARRADLVLPDLRGVLAAALAGAGITVLPRYLCADALATGRLVPLHEPADPPINTLFLAVRAGAPAHPALAEVRNRLHQRARRW